MALSPRSGHASAKRFLWRSSRPRSCAWSAGASSRRFGSSELCASVPLCALRRPAGLRPICDATRLVLSSDILNAVEGCLGGDLRRMSTQPLIPSRSRRRQSSRFGCGQCTRRWECGQAYAARYAWVPSRGRAEEPSFFSIKSTMRSGDLTVADGPARAANVVFYQRPGRTTRRRLFRKGVAKAETLH